jgi:CRP-like cAMP-binding protein
MAGEGGLFKGMNSSTRDTLLKGFPKAKIPAGKLLIRQGDSFDYVFILLTGAVSISYLGSDREIVLNREVAPLIYGAVEAFGETPYLASVRIQKNSEIVKIGRREFLELLQKSHQLTVNLSKHFASIVASIGSERRLEKLATISHRIARFLISEHRGVQGNTIYVNRTELAANLGVSRRSIIRGLQSLDQKKLIKIDGACCVVSSPERLKEFAR